MNEDGNIIFNEDLAAWAKKFHNGRPYTVQCAGTQRINENIYETIFEEMESEETISNQVLLSQGSKSNEAKSIDSLEEFFERKRMNLKFEFIFQG